MFKIFFFTYYYKTFLDELMEELNPDFCDNPDIYPKISQSIFNGSGGSGFVYLCINGKRIFSFGSNTFTGNAWWFLLQINNVFYELLTEKKTGNVYAQFVSRDRGVIFEFILEGHSLYISSTNQAIPTIFLPPQLKNEKVYLYQVVEEVIRAINEYENVFFEAVRRVSPKDLPEVKKLYFNREKVSFSDTPWLPLEQAWQEYKQRHNISDEDVQRIIKQEESKRIAYKINGILQYFKLLKYKINNHLHRFVFNPLYEKRHGKIYYSAYEIEGVDIKSFKVISCPYSKDKNHVYIHNQPIVGVDIESFEVIRELFSKDKNNVYMGYGKIDGAEPQSFVLLGNGYCKDKNSVWWNGNKIENADPDTFELVGYSEAKDKNFTYYQGVKRMEAGE